MKCPRCDKENITVMAKAPCDDAWEVYVCSDCLYSWRSTEAVHISETFKLNDEKIAGMDVIPPLGCPKI